MLASHSNYSNMKISSNITKYLQTNHRLERLPTWRQGQNHLVFNLYRCLFLFLNWYLYTNFYFYAYFSFISYFHLYLYFNFEQRHLARLCRRPQLRHRQGNPCKGVEIVLFGLLFFCCQFRLPRHVHPRKGLQIIDFCLSLHILFKILSSPQRCRGYLLFVWCTIQFV